MHDPTALDALFLPFDEGALPAPRDAAFLGARTGAALHRWRDGFAALEQEFRPTAAALERAGFSDVVGEIDAAAMHAVVLVLPPRQREHARAVLARAVRMAGTDGCVVAAAANTAGARSMQDDLQRLAGPVSVASKHKCRVAWTRAVQADDAVLADWLAFDAPRPILDGAVQSRPGLFAWDRIDPASALLARHVPGDMQGRVADLGAGWGFLSREVLSKNPSIIRLDAFEAQARALAVLRSNLSPFADRIQTHWADVTDGIGSGFDVVVSNPPFHSDDRVDRPELGRRFIEVAAQALVPGGRFFMVANRHLPYEATLRAHFARVAMRVDDAGYKVFEAVR